VDIFKFNNPTHPSKMEQGEIVNGLKSKMWIERYGKEGEFTLIGYARTGLREFLPEGTFISHVDTPEIMVVENHEINSSRGQEAEIKITGRSLEAYILENRVAVPLRAYPFIDADGEHDYYQPAQESHWQIVNLINGVISPGHVWYAEDGIDYVTIYSWIADTGNSPTRAIKSGKTMYEAVLEILAAEKYDIRVYRPGPLSRSSSAVPDENFIIAVHKGDDRSAVAVFSYDLGEIQSADYLWSGKKRKNLALAHSKWVGRRISQGVGTGINKRMMYVDGTNLDQHLAVAPTGATLTQIQNALDRRAQDALNAQTDVNIVNVNIEKEGTHLIYRKDFFVGDLITVNGEYNASGVFRISEYVEVEDERGKSGFPTLTVP
jgi:hypothetical protein